MPENLRDDRGQIRGQDWSQDLAKDALRTMSSRGPAPEGWGQNICSVQTTYYQGDEHAQFSPQICQSSYSSAQRQNEDRSRERPRGPLNDFLPRMEYPGWGNVLIK